MASSSSSAATGSLHPVKLARAPASWSETSPLREQLAALENDVAEYEKLEKKLSTITDEPVWDAMIPLGPLAYFPGQLIHTNDITLTLPSPLPPTTSSSDVPAAQPRPVLKSAKQARETALADQASVEALVATVRDELTKAENEAREKYGPDGLEEGWKMNEKGEVLNEEGLPVFDIREEVPFEEDEEDLKRKAPPPATPQPVKPQMRYLIKKGGKQIVRPLNVPTKAATPPAATPSSSSLPRAPAPAAPMASAKVPSPPAGPSIDTQAILDQLEREEEEEARATDAAEEQDVRKQIEEIPEPKADVKPAQGKAKPAEFLSSFGSGFLNRGNKGKGKAVAGPAPASAPAATAPAATAPPSTSTPSEPIQHEPRHHVLPPPKSIYHPTPPSSVPNSRPSSPRPDRKVAFDVPAASDALAPKPKRAAILLPPPPPPPSDTETPATAPSVAATKKEPFVRPIKDTIVERPIRPPSAPKVRAALSGFASSSKASEPDGPLKTMARPPKVAVSNIVERPTSAPQPFAVPTNAAPPSTGPIHTLALSGPNAASANGMIDEAEYEEPDPSDDGDPSLTSDGESDSSGFYGNEDEEDEDELDIDSALHAREVALEYHRQRMNLGAGAGTGPLGGDATPDAYDSWNQPNVPLDATLQGRTPTSHGSSRFRTGRLESAQMIIPTLLAQQVRTDPSRDEDSDLDDDGLSPAERANIARSLAALAGATNLGGPSSLVGQRVPPSQQPAQQPPSIEQMLGAQGGDQSLVREKAPPTVRSAATPISVPANRVLDAEDAPTQGAELPSGPAPAKKMSRFKARQLGLE